MSPSKNRTTKTSASVLDERIGDRIKIFREHRNMTRLQIAESVDAPCSDDDIADYEAGKVAISVGSLIQIASALYAPIYCFIDEEAMNEWFADRFFFSAYKRLPPATQMYLRKLVTHIANDDAVVNE